MAQKSLFMKIGNFFTISLLHSKMHSPLSNSTLIITLTGRISGDLVTIPVHYVQKGKSIFIISENDRTWWRNLRGGAPVTIHLKGKDINAWADVKNTSTDVAKGICLFNDANGIYTRFFGLSLDEEGNPDTDRLKELAKDRVLVIVKLP
jgi:hypothetical protein